MKHCMYCGYEMPGQAVFCPKCGKKQIELNDNLNHDNGSLNQNYNLRNDSQQIQRPIQKRGFVPFVWGIIFLCLNPIMPFLASIISGCFVYSLRKYPERRKAYYIMNIINVVVVIILVFTGYAYGFWYAFLANV